jgi:hypothetical protein
MKLANLLNFLFGCHHSNLSRVYTIRRRTYRVCCDCGAEFDYALETMTIKPRTVNVPSLHVLKDAGHNPA